MKELIISAVFIVMIVTIIYIGYTLTKFWVFKIEEYNGRYLLYKKYGVFSSNKKWILIETFGGKKEAIEAMNYYSQLHNSESLK